MSERVNGVLDRIIEEGGGGKGGGEERRGREVVNAEGGYKVTPYSEAPLLSIKSYGVQKNTITQLRVFCSEKKKKSEFDVIPQVNAGGGR